MTQNNMLANSNPVPQSIDKTGQLDNFLTYHLDPLTYNIRPINLEDPAHLRCVVSITNKGGYNYLDTFNLYHEKSRMAFVKKSRFKLDTSAEMIEQQLVCLVKDLEKQRNGKEKTETSPEEIPPQQKKEALARLESPGLIDGILADYEKCGYIGEGLNLLVGYLAATSRKLSNPISLLISSRSGAGKSWLLNGILGFMPKEDYFKYTSLTDKTLYYKDKTELKHKILALEEKEGGDRANYSIKNLLSSGGLSISTVIKEPNTGKMKSITYETEGPTNYIGTTTAITPVDYETWNRFIILTVNETQDQTIKILQQQRESRTLDGTIKRRNRWDICSLHQNMQRLLRPLEIVNPLIDKLTFNSHRLIMRRAHLHYLGLIDVIALLHQYQRPVKKAEDIRGEFEYIEVTQHDIDVADEIKDKVLSLGLDDLVPPARNLLCELEGLVAKKNNNGGGPPLFSRKEICDGTGWSRHQINIHLRQLVDFEYVGVVGGSNGVKYLYELLHSGNGNKSLH